MQQQLDWGHSDDEDFPPIEGRSLLYNLPPIGVGTPECEGLISYVVRLAREHSLPVRRFISRIVLGDLGESKPQCDAKFFRQYAATVNGLGPYASKFVAALGDATGRRDLDALTMLPWRNLLAPNGTALTCQWRRWCPDCLGLACVAPPGTDREDGMYWPLSWSIAAVSSCTRHSRALVDACPNCGRRQPTLPRYADLDMCDYCRKPLHAFQVAGVPPTATTSTPAPELSPAAISSSELVGQMIRLGPVIEPETSHKLWIDHVARHIAEAGSDRAAACRQIGLNPRAMYEWFDRGAAVSLESLLKVCVHLGISMDAVFGSRCPSRRPAPPPALTASVKPPRKKHDLATRVLAKAALDGATTEVQPPTLRAIATQLEVSTGFLRYWFPSEVAALHAIHGRLCVEARELRQRRQAELVQDTVQAIVDSGTYPGRKRVEASLRKAGASLLVSPNLRVYRTALLAVKAR